MQAHNVSDQPSGAQTLSHLAGNKPKRAVGGLIVLAMVFCWLICTVAQVEKYIALSRAGIVCGAGCLAVVFTLMILRRLYRKSTDVPWWTLLFTYCLLLGSFAVLYPKSQKHEIGKGSDREDALRVELFAVTHHQYPYKARTFLNHAPTPLPGAMWLAAPFYFAGRIALQNLFWAALFFFFLTRYFHRRVTVLAFVGLLLMTALENLNDFDVGGDYITNILYVTVALYGFSLVVRRPVRGWATAMAVIFLAFTLSSRVIYATAVLPVLALAMQRTRPWRALLLVTAVLLTSALITLPVFYPHVQTNLLAQLNQNADKLRFVARYFPPVILQVAGLGLGAAAFFVRMTLRRVYLWVGLSSLIMLLPTMGAIVLSEGGLRRPLTTDLEYLAVSSIFIALWALSRWEQDGLRSASAAKQATSLAASV